MKQFAAVVVLAFALVTGARAADEAKEQDPQVTAAQMNARLGVEYMKKGDLAVARDKIEKALRQNPHDVSVQLSAGLLYEKLNESAVAEKHYREALKLDKTSPEAQNALGSFYCRNGKPDKGEEMFVKAARNPLNRTPEVAFTNAGVCAHGAKRLESAEGYLRQALKIRPRYAEALLEITGVSIARDQNLQARAFLQRYLEVGQVNPDALLFGVRIERALGDKAAAADYAKQLRTRYPQSEQARQLEELERGAG